MDSWHSYPSIFALGHGAIRALFTVPTIVQEKVDGSQFSFGVDENGEVRCRSKGATLHVDAPEKMFAAAVATAKELAPKLTPGWTYRGEYLSKPKHNSLVYSRIPEKHIILFDINTGHEQYLPYDDVVVAAIHLGLEVVPCFHRFDANPELPLEEIRRILGATSILGGQKIEGIVCKPAAYDLFGPGTGKVMMGKFVSEAFKEIHSLAWKETSPKQNDILEKLVSSFATPARWSKAVLHMKESGRLEGSPRDIGMLLKEVKEDIQRECEEDIKKKLYEWAIPHVTRGSCHGLPEWYKEELLKQQFEGEV